MGKQTMAGTKKHSRKAELRHDVAELRRRLDSLEREVTGLRKVAVAVPGARLDMAPLLRYSARGVKAHRDRFGMSAEAFGKLLGVSSQAIYNWENGDARPRPALLERLAFLRSLGKREAVAQLRAINGHKGKKQS
jgi:DNA-binding transcriptional regulator YiaG